MTTPVDLQRRIAELEEELKEERRLNRDLTRRLLDLNRDNKSET